MPFKLAILSGLPQSAAKGILRCVELPPNSRGCAQVAAQTECSFNFGQCSQYTHRKNLLIEPASSLEVDNFEMVYG